ncbi:MAG: tetratricopeptide repeat protein [Vicinamibacterales bacterium]
MLEERFFRRPIISFAFAAATSLSAAAQTPPDRFVAPLPVESAIRITKDVDYGSSDGRTLRFDLYRPAPAPTPTPAPLVVFFNGLGNEQMRAHVQYQGWGRYVTTRGFAGVTMDSADGTAAADFDTLTAYLRSHAQELDIDADRIVVWACSSNVTNGLRLATDPARAQIQGAVMYYGQSDVTRFRLEVPILMVRAGVDSASLIRGLDAVVRSGTAANAPISLINHPSGRHGFDVRDDNDMSRAVMSQTLDFVASAFDPRIQAARRAGVKLAAASAASVREDWTAATAAYLALTKSHPSDPEYAQRLAEAHVGRGDYASAVPAFEKALELGTPNRGLVTFALVRAHTKLDQIDKAVEAVQRLEPCMRFFKARLVADAEFAALRNDPRFQQLVR